MSPTEPTNTSVWSTLFLHNTWANLKLLGFCEALSDDQLDTIVTGTFGSIRDTLNHLINAEVSYVQRVNGRLPTEPLSWDQFSSFTRLKDFARWSGHELLQLAQSATPDTLVVDQRPNLPTYRQYPLTSLMMQAINHATEHRTQISTILTQLGLEPPDMTGWEYMVEKGEYHESPLPEA